MNKIDWGVEQFHIPEPKHGMSCEHGFNITKRRFGNDSKPGIILLVRSGAVASSTHHITIEGDETLETVATTWLQARMGMSPKGSKFQLVGFWGNNHTEPPTFLVVYHAPSGLAPEKCSEHCLSDELLKLVLHMKVDQVLGFNRRGRLVIWTKAVEAEVLAKDDDPSDKRAELMAA